MSSVERLKPDARQILTAAQDEAISSRSLTIETPHVLLGMLRIRDSIANEVLTDLKIVYDRVLPVVRSTHPGEPEAVTRPTLAPATRRLLDSADEIARQRGDPGVGSEHFLLALVKGDDKSIRYLMREIRLEPQVVRSCIERVLAQESGDTLPQTNPFTEALASQSDSPTQPAESGERERVLQMVEAGTISPQEAAELLKMMRLAAVALDSGQLMLPLSELDVDELRHRTLHITISDQGTNAVKTEIVLPLFQAQTILFRLLRAVYSGQSGVLLDLDGDSDHLRVSLD